MYGGGRSESSVVRALDEGSEVYAGGSFNRCGKGDGVVEIWQYGQYVANRSLFYTNVKELDLWQLRRKRAEQDSGVAITNMNAFSTNYPVATLDTPVFWQSFLFFRIGRSR